MDAHTLACLLALFARVCPTRQENVSSLDLSKFLRLNGARKIGIGTSFALPVVSKWGVTFVIVFYTRDKIQVGRLVRSFALRRVVL